MHRALSLSCGIPERGPHAILSSDARTGNSYRTGAGSDEVRWLSAGIDLAKPQPGFDGIQIVPRTRGGRVGEALIAIDKVQVTGRVIAREKIAIKGYPRVIDANRSEYKFSSDDNSVPRLLYENTNKKTRINIYIYIY